MSSFRISRVTFTQIFVRLTLETLKCGSFSMFYLIEKDCRDSSIAQGTFIHALRASLIAILSGAVDSGMTRRNSFGSPASFSIIIASLAL